jgi:hypothetical protein
VTETKFVEARHVDGCQAFDGVDAVGLQLEDLQSLQGEEEHVSDDAIAIVTYFDSQLHKCSSATCSWRALISYRAASVSHSPLPE